MPVVKDGVRRHTISSSGKWYSPLTEEISTFQSSYERALMGFLDDHGIAWRKNRERFPYELEGKKHSYVPDFYLPDLDMYVETKGFLRKSDPVKFAAFPADKKLVLLRYGDMRALGCEVFDPTSQKTDENAWPLNVLHRSSEWIEEGVLSEELEKKVSSEPFFHALAEKNMYKKLTGGER